MSRSLAPFVRVPRGPVPQERNVSDVSHINGNEQTETIESLTPLAAIS